MWSFIASHGQGGVGGTDFTTSAIDTTGADLVLVSFTVSNFSGSTDFVDADISDNYGNTWLLANAHPHFNNANNQGTKLYYCQNPTVGAAHTFTTIGGGYCSLTISAWSGSAASPLDVTSSDPPGWGPTFDVTDVTPTEDNTLCICHGYDNVDAPPTNDESYTVDAYLVSVGGNNIGGFIASKVQSTAAATGPVWQTGSLGCVGFAAFKMAAVAGPFDIDGTPVSAQGVFGGNPANTVTMPNFSTTYAGDVVLLTVNNATTAITSVTGSTLGAFTKIGSSSGGTPPAMEVYAAFAPAALVNEVVSIVLANNYDPSFTLFAVSGSNQTSLTGTFETFIGNELGSFNGTMPQNFTTVNADAMIIGAVATGFGAVPATPGTGFTFIGSPTGRLTTLYKVRSSIGTDSISTNEDNLAQAMVGFAVIKATSGGTNITPTQGNVALSTTAPTVTRTNNQIRDIPQGNLALSSTAPTVVRTTSRARPIFRKQQRFFRKRA